ncbi:cytochrome P450 2C31-like isoform X2 [Dermacentor albipictus]
MEERMTDAFRELEACIGDKKGEPVSIRPILISCFTKNVTSFFYPNGLLGGDIALCKVTRILEALQDVMMGRPNMQLLPGLIRNLLYYIPFSRNAQVDGIMNELDKFIRDQIESYKPNPNGNDGRGFIEAYMKKIEEARQEPSPTFQERFLVGNVKTFLIAGIFSTTNTMHLHLLNFAARRDVQCRVQREIDEVIGTERLPTWLDRRRMHYTLACMWEILRWKPAPPLGIPREANEHIVVDGFVIPRGTVVLFNMWAAHYDTDLWPEPHRFDPRRFLDKDGCFIPEKLDNMVLFSVGKRSCPGDVFALMEIFMLVTFLLQKYSVVLEEPLQDDLDDLCISLEKLHHVRVRFVPRHSAEA